MLNIVKQKDGHYIVFYETDKVGVKLEEFLQDIDVFIYFWPELKGGCWSACLLHAIANKLDELNKPWNEALDSCLHNTNNETPSSSN